MNSKKDKDTNQDKEREEKVDILHEEIKRQYNEIKEAKNKITNTGLTILIAIVLFIASDLLDMKIASSNYIIVIVYMGAILCLLTSLYLILRCLTLEPNSIGVDICALIKGFDENRTKLELKETITKNLKDSFEEQKGYSSRKADYYGKALFLLVVGFILFTILKLTMP